MIVDTSVWIEHLRRGDDRLARVLEDGGAEVHPFVVGELALGNLRNRWAILGWIGELPAVPAASDEEVRYLVDSRRLWGRGIGWVDAHLLAAALLSGTMLLTRDRSLAAVAAELAVAAS